MSLSKELFAVAEIEEDDSACSVAVSKRWIIGDILYWPNTVNADRQRPRDPVIGSWKEYSVKILKDNIDSWAKALDAEKYYAEHRDSESGREAERRKQAKRQHPVNHDANGSAIDVNDLFPKKKVLTQHNNNGSIKKNKNVPTKQKFKNKKKEATKVVSGCIPTSLHISKKGNISSTFVPSPSTSASEPNSIQSMNIPTSTHLAIDVNDVPFTIIVPPTTLDDFDNSFNLMLNDTPMFEDHQTNLLEQNPPQTQQSEMEQNATLFRHSVLDPAQTSEAELLKQILFEIASLKEMMNQERKNRRESEARLQANLDIISEKLASNTKQQSVPTQEDKQKLKEQFFLPIEDKAKVEEFNTFLSRNLDVKEKLIQTIARFGGANHQSKLRMAMRFIIKDDALRFFTWKGTAKKDAFLTFQHINDVLKDAIHTTSAPYTDHHHNSCMKEYCKHAPNRFSRSQNKKSGKGKRGKGKKKVQRKETEPDASNENIDSNDSHDQSGDTDNDLERSDDTETEHEHETDEN